VDTSPVSVTTPPVVSTSIRRAFTRSSTKNLALIWVVSHASRTAVDAFASCANAAAGIPSAAHATSVWMSLRAFILEAS
jgi:hypothetical protein